MTNSKRVVFTMGGKGGVGKTGVMVALAEWFEANEIPVTLLDLDTENKARGSLKHFFNGSVTKVNIHTPAGLDAFVDHLDSGSEIILADMGAGAGQVVWANRWVSRWRVPLRLKWKMSFHKRRRHQSIMPR
jgi:anion-transporting  ArsA/GET3 family ATPase